jgi:hypothetical protein
MRKLAIGVSAFLLGGMSAGAMALIDRPAAQPAPGRVNPPATQRDRIMLSNASARVAMAQGLVDRPIKSILNVPGKMAYGDFHWNDRDVPRGPLWVRVDLRTQLLSVFRGGHEIGTTVILYGADGVATPTGKFPILAKLKDHRSATYDAPMPYTLRLTGDGISIHASNVRWGFATHGCIGVPEAFAAKLFATASVGDQVTIVSGVSRVRQQA